MESEIEIGSKADMLSRATEINKGGFFMSNNINYVIEQIIAMYDKGANPKQFMQSMMQQTPQMGQMQSQLQNMAQGRSPQEFILQIARQNGVSDKNVQELSRILGGK